jgi:hypothetical protein
MGIHLICNAVFWLLNDPPHTDGVSDTLLARYFLTGKHLDYNKHIWLKFGSYIQTHEEHTNNMQLQTIGAVSLGPSPGNQQGEHYFMSLATGCHLICNQWTELPMPNNAIAKVNQLGHQQNMPKTLSHSLSGCGSNYQMPKKTWVMIMILTMIWMMTMMNLMMMLLT